MAVNVKLNDTVDSFKFFSFVNNNNSIFIVAWNLFNDRVLVTQASWQAASNIIQLISMVALWYSFTKTDM